MSDPSTDTWHETMGLSTSAQLRQTQTALSASQADLTAMQRQRDEAREMYAEASNEARVMREAAEQYLEALTKTGADLARVRWRNRILAAENEAARCRLNEMEQ